VRDGGIGASGGDIFRDRKGKAHHQLPVNFAEDDVHGTNDRGHIGELVTHCDVIHRLQVQKTRRANFGTVGFVRAIRDKVNAELAFGGFDRAVDFARWHVKALGVEFEVVD